MLGIMRRVAGKGLAGQLARGGVGSAAVRVASTLLGLVLVVILARLLGPEQYGVYAYVFALVSVLSIPAQFGLPKLVVRETAKAQVSEDWGRMRGIWRWATFAVVVLTLVIVVGSALVAGLFAERFSGNLATFAWGLLLLPLATLAHLRGAALQGLRHVVLGQLPEFILRPLLMVVLILAAAALSPAWRPDAAGAMRIHVISATIAFGVGAWMLYKMRPAQLRDNPSPVYEHRSWLAAAWPLALVSSMQQINTYTDIVMLGFFVPAEDVGLYRVAVQGALLVIFGLQVVTMITSPYLARLHAQNDIKRLQRLITISARVAFAASLAITLVYLFFGDLIIELFFGEEYLRSYEPLLILSAGQVINGMFGPVGMLLSMTGHERDTAKVLSIAALTNVVLNLMLVPLYGMNGAALATALTLTFWNVMLWRYARLRLGIDCKAV